MRGSEHLRLREPVRGSTCVTSSRDDTFRGGGVKCLSRRVGLVSGWHLRQLDLGGESMDSVVEKLVGESATVDGFDGMDDGGVRAADGGADILVG